MTSSGSQNITNNVQWTESGAFPAALQFVVVVHSNDSGQRTSRRRSSVSAESEAADPTYRERKRAARIALAADMAENRAPASLSEVRMSRGMSQSDLAAKTGMTQPHIAKIEARKLGIQLVTARKMATALAITIDELAPLVLPLEADTAKELSTTASFAGVTMEAK